MASKQTVNAGNLEALGAERLAALLLEVSQGNAVVKRRLRMELAGAANPAALTKEIRKRLATIARSRSFVDWQNRKALVDDLQAQRQAIVRVAGNSAAEAVDLLWQFLDLAPSVLERADDNSGAIIGVFQAAVDDLGGIARSAGLDPEALADQVLRALLRNEYGPFDELIPTLWPALGPVGLEHLKQRLTALSREPARQLATHERRVIGWGMGGPLYAEDVAEHARARVIQTALQDVADAQGDVDAYIAQYDERVRKVPRIAAAIARRLLAAGRPDDAWRFIEAADGPRDRWPELDRPELGWPELDWLELDWDDARIEVLDALGRHDEAQASRWSCFERSLSAPHLREYLKRLADFDDFEAEQRALDYAERHEGVLRAVSFLVSWPALDRAARLATARPTELDGNHYEVLTPAADALAGKYPLAATLALRAMIDFALQQGRSSRYGHAARHLRTCAALASAIPDFARFEAHDAYVARLRREHGRKTGFWSAAD